MSELETGNVIAYDEKGNKKGYPVTKRAVANRPSNNKAVSTTHSTTHVLLGLCVQ